MGVQKLEKIVVSDKWIEKFKQDHISRAFEVRLKGGLIKPRHPHRNHPYCNICDVDYEEWDLGYRIFVGGHPVVYHVDCIEANWNTKKVRNILAQDRGYRRKREEKRADTIETKIRAQLYKFIIGSVLRDELSADRSSERVGLPEMIPVSSFLDDEPPTISLDFDREPGRD